MATPEIFQHPLIDQMLAYQDLRDELERDNFGKWVIIHDSELAGICESYEKATAIAREQGLNVLDCLIRQVGVEVPVILSYGR